MNKPPSDIPLEIQLQAICKTRLRETNDVLMPYVPGLKDYDPNAGSGDSFKEYVKSRLTFTAGDLIGFLETHPEICESLLLDSYNKHYSPSTFIEENNGQYLVGWVKGAGDPLETQIHSFSSFAKAIADYVLFSWGFPRLTKDQAEWHEVDQS